MSFLFKLQPLSVAIFIASTSSFAATSEMDASTQAPEIKKLDLIVVTAQVDNTESAGLIVHADPKQPIQPIPANDGAAYLKSIAGFNTVNSGGNGDITFRGMFGSRVKVLTDGTENLGACPSRMDSPTSYISPESFDRITLIKGPQTVQHANTGSAATVLFERDRPKIDQDKPYSGQASVVMGSYGRLDHNVEALVGNDLVYARLNANRSESDSYQDGDGNIVPSAWEKWNTDLTLGFTPSDDTWLELKAAKSDGEALYAGRAMDGSKFARESLGLHIEQKNISEVVKKIEAQIDYSFNDHVMDNFSLRDFKPSGMMKMPMATNVARRTLNTRLAATHQWDKFEMIAGINTQKNEHTTRQGMSNSYINKPRDVDMQFESYGAFIEASYPLNEQHKLVSGLRADRAKVEDLRTNSKTQGYNTELNKTLPSAFIRLENESMHHDAKSYIGLGYVERMPDYWELFSPTQGNIGSTNTFNGINPEKTAQLDLGYEHRHGAFNSWVSGYAGYIQDYILTSYTHSMSGMSHGLSASTKNVDAEIMGAEFGIGYQFTDALEGDISASYARGKNTSDNTPLPQIAPFETRVNLRYVQDRYSLGAYWRFVDDQHRIALQQGNIVGYDMKKSAGFSTLSLNASYQIMPDLDLAIGIDNLLDKTYTEHLNKAGNSGFGFASDEQFNNIGRNYWARMNIKF